MKKWSQKITRRTSQDSSKISPIMTLVNEEGSYDQKFGSNASMTVAVAGNTTDGRIETVVDWSNVVGKYRVLVGKSDSGLNETGEEHGATNFASHQQV